MQNQPEEIILCSAQDEEETIERVLTVREDKQEEEVIQRNA